MQFFMSVFSFIFLRWFVRKWIIGLIFGSIFQFLLDYFYLGAFVLHFKKIVTPVGHTMPNDIISNKCLLVNLLTNGGVLNQIRQTCFSRCRIRYFTSLI